MAAEPISKAVAINIERICLSSWLSTAIGRAQSVTGDERRVHAMPAAGAAQRAGMPATQTPAAAFGLALAGRTGQTRSQAGDAIGDRKE
jgi:hypothetical protein